MKRLILIPVIALCALGCKNTSTTAMNRDFLQLAEDRYSVREFDSKAVGQDIVDKIINAGMLAPTAVNSQPQKIYVVRSESGMEILRNVSPCMYGAPHCFILCYNDENVCPRGKNDNYGDIDVSIVITHMALEAANLGVGTCIVGYFDPARLSQEFGLPDNIHPVLLMPFGYPSKDCKPSERHSECRSLDEVVEYK